MIEGDGRHRLRGGDAPMNVLILHNRYREPGGEERSVARDRARCCGRAATRVEVLERTERDAPGARARARRWRCWPAGSTRRRSSGPCARTAPTSCTRTTSTRCSARGRWRRRGAAGARVVMHLHNYRLVCAIAIDYRDGEVCTRCRGRNTLPGVRLRCRGNLPEAVAYGAGPRAASSGA